jgi:hypothetical protein
MRCRDETAMDDVIVEMAKEVENACRRSTLGVKKKNLMSVTGI